MASSFDGSLHEQFSSQSRGLEQLFPHDFATVGACGDTCVLGAVRAATSSGRGPRILVGHDKMQVPFSLASHIADDGPFALLPNWKLPCVSVEDPRGYALPSAVEILFGGKFDKRYDHISNNGSVMFALREGVEQIQLLQQ